MNSANCDTFWTPKTRSQRFRLRRKLEADVFREHGAWLESQDEAVRIFLGGRCKRLKRSPLLVIVSEMILFETPTMQIVSFLRENDPWNFSSSVVSDDALRMEVTRMRRFFR